MRSRRWESENREWQRRYALEHHAQHRALALVDAVFAMMAGIVAVLRAVLGQDAFAYALLTILFWDRAETKTKLKHAARSRGDQEKG